MRGTVVVGEELTHLGHRPQFRILVQLDRSAGGGRTAHHHLLVAAVSGRGGDAVVDILDKGERVVFRFDFLDR